MKLQKKMEEGIRKGRGKRIGARFEWKKIWGSKSFKGNWNRQPLMPYPLNHG